MNTEENIIPVHLFDDADTLGMPFKIEGLEVSAGYPVNTAHRHNYYEVFLFEQGTGEHIIDFTPYSIQPGCVHIVFPGQIHKLNRSQDSKGKVVTFTENFVLPSQDLIDLINNLGAHKDTAETIVLNPVEFYKIYNLIDHINNEINGCNLDCTPAIRSYIYIILYKYYLQKGIQKDDLNNISEGRLFSKFKKMLEAKFRDWHMPGQYAEALNTSLKVLNNECTHYSAKHASDIIRERIILEAKRLLFNTDLMSKEIAYQLNFEDPAHFSKFFKQYTGLSVKEYREESQKRFR